MMLSLESDHIQLPPFCNIKWLEVGLGYVRLHDAECGMPAAWLRNITSVGVSGILTVWLN